MTETTLRRRTVLKGVLAFGGVASFGGVQGALALQRNGWRMGTSVPLAVQEIYPALHQGRIHLGGGLLGEDGRVVGVTDTHHSWAPGEDRWRAEAPLPRPLHHPNLVSSGGDLFALGGFATEPGQVNWIMQDSTLRYVSEDNAWVTLAPAPAPHGETVCAALASGLHVVGGRTPMGDANRGWRDHIDTDNHFVYEVREDRWRRVAPLPTSRNSAAGAVLSGKLHVVGGRTVGGGNNSEHDVYDPRRDRWTARAPLPQGQGGLAAAALGGKLYAFGGEFFEGDGGVYPEVWVYDPAADTWAAAEPMPTPRHGLGAVTLDGEIYVIAGAAAVGGRETSTIVEVFEA